MEARAILRYAKVSPTKATRPEEAKCILTSSFLFLGRVSLSKEVLSNGV